MPDDVLEAAKVDGATRFQRLRLVTLPIIPSHAAARTVVMGSIWTFNTCSTWCSSSPAATRTARQTSSSPRPTTGPSPGKNQYGYAAAYAVLIFVMLFGVTRLLDRARHIHDAGGGPSPLR